MPLFLSHEDVSRLLTEPSAAARAMVAAKLGQELDNPTLSAADLSTAQEIARLMTRDIEVTVRQALSQSLRLATNLPHDVALRLAQDVEQVALPMLTSADVLTDDDLIALLRAASPAKQEAIAARPRISEPVSDVLIDEGAESAVAVLMGNPGAAISERGMLRAVDRFGENELVTARMVHRASLPPRVAERLVVLVSDRLRGYLVRHHDMPAAAAADIVLQSREQSVVSLSHGASEEELADLIQQMQENGRLTPSLLLRMLCMGDIAFFEMAVARLAHVPVANARILIHDAGRKGLASLCERAGLPPRVFPVIRTAIDVVNETGYDGGERDLERFRARVISRVLTQFDDFGQEDLDYLVAKLGDVITHAA